MAPAGADVEEGDYVVAFAEEFVACHMNYGAQTEDEDEGNENHCYAAEYHVSENEASAPVPSRKGVRLTVL